MEDIVAGFQAAPLWAQIGMVFFAITALVMVGGPSVKRRKFRRHFDEISRGLGAAFVSGDWPVTSRVSVSERPFEILYNIRDGRGGSYRGRAAIC